MVFGQIFQNWWMPFSCKSYGSLHSANASGKEIAVYELLMQSTLFKHFEKLIDFLDRLKCHSQYPTIQITRSSWFSNSTSYYFLSLFGLIWDCHLPLHFCDNDQVGMYGKGPCSLEMQSFTQFPHRPLKFDTNRLYFLALTCRPSVVSCGIAAY